MSNHDLECHGEIKDACYDIDVILDDLWEDVIDNEDFIDKYNLINNEVGKILDWYSEKRSKLKYIVNWMSKYNSDKEIMNDKLKTLKRSLKFLKNDIEAFKTPPHTIS
jgi:hypothetical protein